MNFESKRKKKAAFGKVKGRPKVITVLFLSKLLPKSAARECIKQEIFANTSTVNSYGLLSDLQLTLLAAYISIEGIS